MLISIKMKKNLERVIEFPEGFKVTVDGHMVKISKEGKDAIKRFRTKNVDIKLKDNKLIISSENATRRESRMMGTIEAHIKNMIKGFEEGGFKYSLEICSVHFPMNVKTDGNEIVIKSFLGENGERRAKIIEGVKVDIKGTNIDVSGDSIEAAGQTAANIEKATRLKGRDRRIFQDGIFITSKPGGVL